jgi:aerobic carbon-monoxide dehydrogenase large subunit
MALLEEIAYDESGQLLTDTLMDYLPPTATDVSRIRIAPLEKPSPHAIALRPTSGEELE